MKILKIGRKSYKRTVLADVSEKEVGYGWSHYDGSSENGVYSITLPLSGEGPLMRVEMSHDELARLVKYWKDTESGERRKLSPYLRGETRIG